MSVSPTEKSDAVDDCHLVTVPVSPLNVKVVELVPEQTVALPAILPPTEAGSTVTVASAELDDEQLPLVITARYLVMVVKFVAVCVVVVLAISTGVTQLSVLDCHLVIVPVWPDKVSNVLFVPVHTVELPAILPPTETGSTVTVTSAVLGVQVPLLIVQRNT